MSQSEFYDISLESLNNYLLNTGWIANKDYNNKNAERFLREESGFTILVPTATDFEDFEDSIQYTINRIAQYENRIVEDLINDLKKTSFIQYIIDGIDYRVADDITTFGCIGLDRGAAIISALRELIEDSQRNEIEPRAFYDAKKKINTNDYYRLAQTKKGSYIFRVETTKMELQTAEQLGFNGESKLFDIPLQRKVLERINYSLHQIEDSLASDSLEKIVDGEQYHYGLNANMCESLLKLMPESYGISNTMLTNMKFDYCPYLKNSNIITKNDFNLKAGYTNILEESSKLLRRIIVDVDGVFTGRIVNLDAKDSLAPDSDKLIKIDLIHSIPEVSFRTFKAHLNVQQYADAVIAHGSNKIITIEARIKKDRYNWIAENVNKFNIID